jgi:hypothetical protein
MENKQKHLIKNQVQAGKALIDRGQLLCHDFIFRAMEERVI